MSTGLSVPTLQRFRHRHPIPEGCRPWPTDPKEVVIEEPSMQQEIDAAMAAQAKGQGNIAKANDYELLKRVVVEVDGQFVSDHDWIERTSSQFRTSLRGLLGKILAVPDESFEELLKKGVVEA